MLRLPSPSVLASALLSGGLFMACTTVLSACPSGAEAPNAGYLSGASPGQVDQPCRTNNRCDGTLRCVDDDGDDATAPTCRERCIVAEPRCGSAYACRGIPNDEGNGVCLPRAPSGEGEGEEEGEGSGP